MEIILFCGGDFMSLLEPSNMYTLVLSTFGGFPNFQLHGYSLYELNSISINIGL